MNTPRYPYAVENMQNEQQTRQKYKSKNTVAKKKKKNLVGNPLTD